MPNGGSFLRDGRLVVGSLKACPEARPDAPAVEAPDDAALREAPMPTRLTRVMDVLITVCGRYFSQASPEEVGTGGEAEGAEG